MRKKLAAVAPAVAPVVTGIKIKSPVRKARLTRSIKIIDSESFHLNKS